jgi:hypothetical protein
MPVRIRLRQPASHLTADAAIAVTITVAVRTWRSSETQNSMPQLPHLKKGWGYCILTPPQAALTGFDGTFEAQISIKSSCVYLVITPIFIGEVVQPHLKPLSVSIRLPAVALNFYRLVSSMIARVRTSVPAARSSGVALSISL